MKEAWHQVSPTKWICDTAVIEKGRNEHRPFIAFISKQPLVNTVGAVRTFRTLEETIAAVRQEIWERRCAAWNKDKPRGRY